VANYGYDWAMKKDQKPGTPPENNHTVSAQEAWLEAAESDTDINFDDDAMNPHFAYLDGDNTPRCVVSGWSHRAESDAGRARAWASIPSRYGVWDRKIARCGRCGTSRSRLAPLTSWTSFPPVRTWTIEGSGEIIRIQSRPSAGERTHHSRSRNPIWSATKSSRPCRCRTSSTCMAVRRKRRLR
jgi:hypothetical protein